MSIKTITISNMEKNSLTLVLACMTMFASDHDSGNSNDKCKSIRELHDMAANASRQSIDFMTPPIEEDNRSHSNKDEDTSHTDDFRNKFT